MTKNKEKENVFYVAFKIIFFPILIMVNPKIYFKDEIEKTGEDQPFEPKSQD